MDPNLLRLAGASEGPRVDADVARCMSEGLRQGAGPAIACFGAIGGEIFHAQAIGEVGPPSRHKCGQETLFDLDALTMPLAAGVAAMWGVGKGRIALEAPIGRILPELAAAPWGGATIEQLLGHTAGLPAEVPLYQRLIEAERFVHPKERAFGRASAQPMMMTLAAKEPKAPPGAGHPRSKLGFLVLGWALARRLGAPLDAWLTHTITKPMGLAELVMFLPPDAPHARRAAAGPVCPVRGRTLVGEAADLNAWAQGGVAGHAGLFATASGAGRLGYTLVEAQRGNPRYWSPATVAKFWARGRHEAPQHALAWQRPAGHKEDAFARRLPATAVSFTCERHAIWLDPASQFVGVVLTGGGPPPASPEVLPAFFRRVIGRMIEVALARPPDAG